MSRFSFSFDEEPPDRRVSSGTSGPLRVLAVCTGNIARSALAEALIRDGSALAGDAVSVSSAGTAAVVDFSATAEMQELGHALGVDLIEHRARQLTEALILESDLVLTATREHRAAAVQLVPAARPKVFTLVEFARTAVVARAGGARTPFDRAFVADVIRIRPSLVPLIVADDDDIADPYRQTMAVNRAVAARISATVAELLGVDARPVAFG